MFDVYELVKPSIRTFTPYKSARSIGGNGNIFLNANESPFSFPYELTVKKFNRYPEPQSVRIINKYALYSNIDKQTILITRGSDEGIDLLIKTFCDPEHDRIIFCSPTYDMYYVSSEINGIKSFDVPMLDNWQLNLNDIQLALNNVKIIFICRPNNPTGNLVNKDQIVHLLKVVNESAIVVVDEAYIEFCMNHTLVSLIEQYPNLVILRTLSKAFGLAGLRCGFVLANEKVIKLLNTIISPYPISTPVENIVYQALNSYNIDVIKNNVLKINKNRQYLLKILNKLRCVENVFPSETNYVLVKFYFHQIIFKQLMLKGIIVRNQDHKKRLEKCLRISIGSINECIKLVSVLQNISDC